MNPVLLALQTIAALCHLSAASNAQEVAELQLKCQKYYAACIANTPPNELDTKLLACIDKKDSSPSREWK